jgi:dihydroflavonol-4-reductase
MNYTRPIVCVTGAAGFIATHIVEQLLAKGYLVRGTVRNALGPGCAHLRQIAGAEQRLQLIEADLLDPEPWVDAVADCEYVLHTASPYTLNVEQPQRDLVEPAVHGTRNVLAACLAQPRPPRVVLTSSTAAITDGADADRVLTEADWNERSSLDRNPYYYAKTLAEREAWRLVEEQPGKLALTVINPFLVIGPSRSGELNTSNAIFADLLNGTYPGIMRLCWGFVDVRDVARAHLLAMETRAAQGRYICSAQTITMRRLVELLASAGYGDYPLPKLGRDGAIGDHAVRLSSYLQPRGVGSYLRTHGDRELRFDNRKIVSELALDFRPLEETVRATAEDLIRHGHVRGKPESRGHAGSRVQPSVKG